MLLSWSESCLFAWEATTGLKILERRAARIMGAVTWSVTTAAWVDHGWSGTVVGSLHGAKPLPVGPDLEAEIVGAERVPQGLLMWTATNLVLPPPRA